MKILKNQSLLPLFRRLLDLVNEKSELGIDWFDFSFKQMTSLSEFMSSDNDDINISDSSLRDYGYMYQRREKYPLKVQWDKLERLCDYSGLEIELFEQPTKGDDEVIIAISSSFLDAGKFAERLKRRYKRLAETYGISGDLKVELLEASVEVASEAEEAALRHQADFVFWGEVDYNGKTCDFELLISDPERFHLDTYSRGFVHPTYTLDELSRISRGEVFYEPEYLLFYALASVQYRKNRGNNDQKALALWQKVNELNPKLADPYFYQAVIHHTNNRLFQAKPLYEKALAGKPISEELPFKLALNYALLLLSQPSTKGLEKAASLLKGMELSNTKDVNKYSNQYHALNFQLYRKAGNTKKARESLNLWGKYALSFDLPNIEASVDTSKTLLVLSSGDKVFRKGGYPIVDRELIQDDELLYAQTGKRKIVLQSLETAIPFFMHVEEESQRVSEAIVPFDEFRAIRGRTFEYYKSTYPWIILESTLYEPVNSDWQYYEHTLRFSYQGTNFSRRIPVENGQLVFNKESILINGSGQPFFPEEPFTNIQLDTFNPFDSLSESLPIKGLVFMDQSHLDQILTNFQLSLQDLPQQELLKKTARFIYQTYGAIPEEYLISRN